MLEEDLIHMEKKQKEIQLAIHIHDTSTYIHQELGPQPHVFLTE